MRHDMERIVKLDVGCRPEAAVSGPVLLQTDDATFLTFNAVRETADGTYADAGTAIIEFKACSATKFGYPNDEAWIAIPRTKNLDYGVYEVLDSAWKSEISQLNRYAFPETKEWGGRHFLILFHDSSFECVAQDYEIEITHELYEDIWTRVYQRALRYAIDSDAGKRCALSGAGHRGRRHQTDNSCIDVAERPNRLMVWRSARFRSLQTCNSETNFILKRNPMKFHNSLLAVATLAVVTASDTDRIGDAADAARPSMGFFVTSAKSKMGNLGGLAGAGRTCQTLAAAVGQGGEDVARLLECGA